MCQTLPKPEFVTANLAWICAYGWKCDAHGIMVFGDTEVEALTKWQKSYQDEYGTPFVHQVALFETA
jgi:hypothetical protein